MAYDSRAVANYILEKARERGFKLTPMHLIKLVYLAHGWSLALFDRPLIDDKIEAWDWGPVVPKLYSSLRRYGSGEITEPIRRMKLPPGKSFLEIVMGEEEYEPVTAEFTNNEKGLLDRVVDIYGPLKAFQLSALTHATGSPWQKVYQPTVRHTPITDNLIKSDFKRQAEENAKRRTAS